MDKICGRSCKAISNFNRLLECWYFVRVVNGKELAVDGSGIEINLIEWDKNIHDGRAINLEQ